jgi:hypothetical protein
MIKSGIMTPLKLFFEALGEALRRGAPWRGRITRDFPTVLVEGKGGPAAKLSPQTSNML